MSDDVKSGESGQKFTPEKSGHSQVNDDRSYEKLVEKSRDENITDTSISRADITNPNLHYGIEEKTDAIEAARPIEQEASPTDLLSELPSGAKEAPVEERDFTPSPETVADQPQSSFRNSTLDVSKPEQGSGSNVPPTELETAEPAIPQADATPAAAPDPQGEATPPVSNDGDAPSSSFTPDLVASVDTVDENAAAGTVVATLDLEDAAGSSYSYAITDENGNAVADSVFSIIGNQVVVAPGADINYEDAQSHSFFITGFDSQGNSATEQLSVTFNDVDEFEVSTIQDTDSRADSITENTAIGTPVGITAYAFDADGTTNNVTYSLSDDAGGLFAIDPETGEVTVAAPIDFEATPNPVIEITAKSEDGSTSTKSFAINVNDVDEFDISAISDSDDAANTVAENAAVGTSVGITAFASDADGSNSNVTYSLSDDAGGLFAIDPNTGEVTVAGDIDFESGASQTIVVTATSEDGSTSSQSYTIAVTDQDEFDVSAVSDSDDAANTVAENAAVGTSVGITAFAADADGSNSNVTYSLSDDAGGLFAIDPETGEVTVAGDIDFESGASQTIEVTATSEDGSTSSQSYTIAVTDQDEFDVSAVSDSDDAANTVSENAAVGTSVGITAFASDADGSNNGITYSLSDDAGGLFAIDPNTGEVTVAGDIDFEASASQTIEVTATSEDGSTSSQSYNIAVTDQDEFDVSAVSDSNDAANTVAENAAVGTSVGITAFASDADGSNSNVTYSLSDDADGLFTIDPNTGEVTVAGDIDFESGASQTIEVTATSEDGSTSSQSYTIAVTDQDEFDISAVSDSDDAANNVAENAAVGTSVGITAFASDADGSNNNVTYSLSDDAGGLFTIDPNTGEVTVAGDIDFESGASQTIEVTATSEDGSTSSQSYTIAVTDQDEFDVSAVSDSDDAANTVSENAAVGTSVGITAFAADADGSNSNVTYSLSDDAGGLFAIDPNTGEVTVAGDIDFEAGASQTIEVTATSEDGSTSSQSYTIAVTDQDEFDVSAVSDSDDAANTVAENAAVGTSVGITAFASDADGSNSNVTYSLSDDVGGLFAIDPETGEVTVAGDIDFESGASQTIEVTATSEDGSTSSQSYTIAVTDQDEFDVSAVSDSDDAANTVAENAAVGTSVGITAFASDADGSNNGITYSLSDDAGGLFSIDPNTGEVTVAGDIDFESGASQTIEVTATSEDGSTSSQSYTIAVTDQDEFDVSAVSDSDNTANTVAENAAVGTSVGITAFASDADGSNSNVTYSLSDDAGGLFAIDPNTGEVTVAGDIDFEAGASQTIEVTATSEDGSTSSQSYTIAVTDQDEFDVSAVSDSDDAANTVSENAAVGTSVGITAFAADADGSNSNVTYSLSDDAGGLFAIDPNTGEVTVAGDIDFEAGASQTIEVTATSEDGSTSSQSYTIAVTDQDEFDISAVSDSDDAANTVAENAAVGTSVGITAFAADADGSNSNVTYSLSDDAGGLFAIDPNTGEVTVAGDMDFEAGASQTIEVTATSEDGSTSSQSYTIAVTDQDEFDVSAVSDSDDAANTVAENAAVGTSVGITAFASDADGSNSNVTYSLSDDAGGLFAIDPETGEVTVAGDIDFEAGASQTIEVTATSEDGSTSSQSYTIAVTDQDEFDVSAVSDSDDATNTVAENAAVGTSVGITAFAADADGSNSNVTYSLSDDAGGLFAIDPNTGEVTVAGDIDFEAGASQTIEVTATSEDGSTSSQSYTIAVTDQDEFDVSAVSDSDGAANTVAENAAVGTSVGITAFASDADGSNNNVTYSLSDDAGGLFAIDPETGEVTVAGDIDFEAGASQTIEVTATSEDGSTSSQSYTIAVTDQDEFDVSAVSDSDDAANTVAENAAVGTSVGITAFAADADGSNNGITYSLSDDAGGLFSIDPNTGEVTVAGDIDFESGASQTIEVTATSEDGSTSSQSYSIAVTDQDEFDVSAVSDSDDAANTVAENAAVGTSVGITAFASDADGSNSNVTYSLSDDAGGLFAIDPNTGEVTVAGDIDFESGASQTIEVTATSEDGSTSSQSYTIAVTDQDEFDVSPVTDSDATENTVAENAGIGDVVGITAVASDADGSNSNVTYSLSDDADGLFAIDPNTGVVTVADTLDAETATSHNITVVATSEDGSSSNETFTIGVNDVNETSLSAISDTNSDNNQVSEAAAVGTAVGITAFASDADVSDTVTYSLSSNPGGFFAIDASTGVVTVANGLDFEANENHVIEVTATSSDGSTSTETFTIDVTDENEADVSAISDSDRTTNSVDENSAVGTSVGITAFASDADGTDNEVTYSLSDDAGGLFTIDPNTGEVTLAGSVDHETADQYSIEVTATSADGSTSTRSFDIDINDVNEDPSDINFTGGNVDENSAAGTVVASMSTVDVDEGDSHSYQILNDPTGALEIVGNEIRVRDGGTLDYESGNTDNPIDVPLSQSTLDSAAAGNDITISGIPEGSTLSAGVDNGDGTWTISSGDVTGNLTLTPPADHYSTIELSVSGGEQTTNYIDADFSGGSDGFSYNDTAGTYSTNTSSGDLSMTLGGVDDSTQTNMEASFEKGFNVTEEGTGTLDIDFRMTMSGLYEDDEYGEIQVRIDGELVNIGANDYVLHVDGSNSNNDNYDSGWQSISIDLGDLSAGAHTIELVGFSNKKTTSGESLTVEFDNVQLDVVSGSSETTFIEPISTYDVTVQTTDEGGNTYEETVTISVNDVNDTGSAPTDMTFVGNPELAPQGTTLSAGSVVADVTSVVDSDEGDSFTFALNDDADGKFAINAETGEITLVNSHDVSGTYSDTVTVEVTDQFGNSFAETIGIQFGTEGADDLTGSDLTDIIYGFDGNDTLSGGAGDDYLVAGESDYDTIGASGEVGYNYSLIHLGRAEDIDTDESNGTSENAGNLLGTYGDGNSPLFNNIVSARANDSDGDGRIDDNDNGNTAETVTIGGETKTLDSNQTYNATITYTDGSTASFSAVVSQFSDGNFYLNPEMTANSDADKLTAKPIQAITLDSVLNSDSNMAAQRLDMDYSLPGGGDTLNGGEGNDTLVAGSGYDTIDGGEGTDMVDYSTASSGVNVDLTNTDAQDTQGSGMDTITNVENVSGSDFDDNITGDENANVIYGNGGDDTIIYGTGGDTVYGGDGDDVIDDAAGTQMGDYADTIYGEAGNDTIWTGGGADILDGGTGDDTLYGEGGDDTLIGGTGNDTLNGGDGNDLFIFQEGDGADVIIGGSGASWTDTIELQDAFGGGDLGTYGTDWTVTLNEGSIESQTENSIDLTDDADGVITLQDGSTIDFTDIERIEW